MSSLPPTEPSTRSPRTLSSRAGVRHDRSSVEYSSSRTIENPSQNKDRSRSGSDWGGRDVKQWSDQSGIDDSPEKKDNWSGSESTRRRERGRVRDRGR